ncbi:ABC transporter ATP-binding protein [Planococcus soli]|uniref:ABC transporter ATP-binding protein n=1 Tax=Planococcus soli TaxID=2666072 RepID=UPI00115D7F2B|nr:ABC transporter ATP-binding protein [Planococcus soli]
MDIAVSVKDITKKYSLYKDPWGPIKEVATRKKLHKDFFALLGVTLDFPKGESIGILGKNGSGKSTLLKIITGITEPTSGKVDVQGSIVFLDVSSGIDSELSGYDNIFMKGTLLGYTKQDMLAKIDDIIEFSELGEFIGQPVKNYSSGMKAKLGFAISVNVDPDILIVDEALAVGDASFQKKCMAKMNDFKLQGKTIIFVSHDNHAIESFCSKAAWIHQGELVTYGDAKFVGSMYGEFMSGRKPIESILAEIQYEHAINQVAYAAKEDGFSLQITGILRNQQRKNVHERFQLAIRDDRTGETIMKNLSSANQGFTVDFSEKEFPLFFKPGKFSFWLHEDLEEDKEVEFSIWAGNAAISASPSSGYERFRYHFNVQQNNLHLAIENIEKAEQQVNRIWIEDELLHIDGIAFVRGYETKSPDDLAMKFYLTELNTFKRHAFPVTISETEDITENPAYNPQGKVYNFSRFQVAIDLRRLEIGSFESHLSYIMEKEPHHQLLNLVWASKASEYPAEPYSTEAYTVHIQTANKYLRLEKRARL